MLGVGLLYWNATSSRGMPARDVRRRRANMRYALGGVFTLTFVLTLFVWDFTSRAVIYRTEIAQLEKAGEGWAVTPPIFFHPANTADDNSLALERALKPPSFEDKNLLGTDPNGRDVFTRLLYGTRISLTIGIIAVSIYVTIGIILGSLAGYFGGKVDLLIMFVLQVMLCIPTFFLLLTIIALFDTRSIFMIMVAIGVTGWTGVTRLVRGEFFRQRSIEYVTAAKCLGIPERKIIFGHILKNSVGPVLVAAAFGIAGAILAESFLSFLGLGDTNAPSWGQILRQGQTERKAWLIFSPGLAIFFVVTILNLVGEGLRDALDPKLRT
jgi:peptide/nickel transport system permease protein